MGLEKLVRDPTALLVIDEADRLKIAGLKQARSIFDQGGIEMILIGMPGLEKRLARYPQFYSRIGFVHEFRPLASTETRHPLERGWGATRREPTQAALGARNSRDNHPDDGWQLPPVESSTRSDGANSRNQWPSRGHEGGCGSGSGKLGDRRSLRLPEACRATSER